MSLPAGSRDCISSVVKRADSTLVTANTREFARVEGLAVADWEAEPTA